MLLKRSFFFIAIAAMLAFSSVTGMATGGCVSTDNFAQAETPVIEDGIIGNILRANHLVIDDEAISTSDKSWSQPSGYASYRIFITNTRNEKLSFTVSYGSNSYSGSVSANGSNTITVNNAHAVKHYVAFSTSSGSVSGHISVRVSDTAL